MLLLLQNRTLAFLRTKLLKSYSIFSPITTATTTMISIVDEKVSSDSPDAIINAPLKNIDESDVGILCYISQLPGFRGILKQRYSDFIVNEVALDGNVVHLTSLHVPPELVDKKEETVTEKADKSYTSEIEAFRSLVGDTDADRLKDLIEKINSGVENDISPLVLSPSSDKVHRTAVHNFFKEKLKFLVTDTIDGPQDSSKCIRVRLYSSGNQNKGRNFRKRKDRDDKPFDKRGSDEWPDHLGKFLRFHLYKENKDTQEALRLIGKMLGVQPKTFGFSGTKDKRAVSTQMVTMFKQCASRLASLNARLIGIKVGDFCYAKEGLQLGQLLGNRFTITLRGVSADSEETIRASADALGKHGFINYFGLQRFGSGSVPTHLIGSALLRGEWKAAVDMLLDPRDGEREAVRKVREHYKESSDVEGALRRLPHNMVAERAVLLCLKKCPGNYSQALKAIPRTMRMMYVHSYQSYLWNHAASFRVQKYGVDTVVAGDLVYCKENSSEVISVQTGCEDDIADEADNSSNLEEAEVNISDERHFTVKESEKPSNVGKRKTNLEGDEKKGEGSPASKKNKTMRTEIPKIPIGSHDDNRKGSLDKKEKKQSEDSPRKSKEKHDRSKERGSKSRHDKSKRPTSQSTEVQSNAKLPDGTNFEIYKKKIDEQLAIVDPNVGVSESVRLKTAPVISFAKEFGEGKSGPCHDDNDLTGVPSTSKFDGQARKRLALEMVKCALEGYSNSLKGYAEAHITPIMALVRLDGVSKRASQTRKDVNEAVHVATQAGDYAWKMFEAVRLEQRGIEEALNKENLELKISHANIVQANQELVARCEGHEQRYLASTILCAEQSQRIRELEDKLKAADGEVKKAIRQKEFSEIDLGVSRQNENFWADKSKEENQNGANEMREMTKEAFELVFKGAYTWEWFEKRLDYITEKTIEEELGNEVSSFHSDEEDAYEEENFEDPAVSPTPNPDEMKNTSAS